MEGEGVPIRDRPVEDNDVHTDRVCKSRAPARREWGRTEISMDRAPKLGEGLCVYLVVTRLCPSGGSRDGPFSLVPSLTMTAWVLGPGWVGVQVVQGGQVDPVRISGPRGPTTLRWALGGVCVEVEGVVRPADPVPVLGNLGPHSRPGPRATREGRWNRPGPRTLWNRPRSGAGGLYVKVDGVVDPLVLSLPPTTRVNLRTGGPRQDPRGGSCLSRPSQALLPACQGRGTRVRAERGATLPLGPLPCPTRGVTD